MLDSSNSSSMPMEKKYVDVLVCGGGMSGMACAAFSAQAGAKVLVIEKQDRIGGSSLLSAGMFWGPKSIANLRKWVPYGDPTLQKSWMEDYLPAVQWMINSGVSIAPKFEPIMTIGIGYPISIQKLHEIHQSVLINSGTSSSIKLNTSVVKLLQEHPNIPGSKVVGAIIKTNNDGQDPVFTEVRSRIVVLATGGFQGNSRLTSTHLGQGADNIFVRSNKGSTGDGLTLAETVGAGASRGLNTFYGHLLASPLSASKTNPADFLPLAQYQSKHCLLVNESGKRFVDETLGDEVVNQYLAKEEGRRGFIIFNEGVRQKFCMGAPFPNAGNVDRLAKAKEYGCRVATVKSLNELPEVLNKWGADGGVALKTVMDYDPGSLSPKGNSPSPETLKEGDGPFHVMEVQPSITFTYGGIKIDSHARVLSAFDGAPIPGLLCCGVDAGGFSNLGYAGGLALAFVSGVWASQSVARTLGLQVPSLPKATGTSMDDLTIKFRNRL